MADVQENLSSQTVPVGQPCSPCAQPASPRPSPFPGALPDSLLARLLEELASAWRGGKELFAEELIRQHPELEERSEPAVRLIYEEVCLREEQGEEIVLSDVVKRFPRWKSELEVLLDCHGLLQALTPEPLLPAVGDTLGDFVLVSVLGCGARGKVFLARQPSLADRPVVLKVTSREGEEHASLARLQHTHIVPLFGVEELRERDLRLMCMPYLGGVTLSRIVTALRDQPLYKRTGRDLVKSLDRFQAALPIQVPQQGPVRQLLLQASYAQAVCWMGACLADALHYAHERGLVHLDLKPSNVLLAADGQPLLLDFHLTREPVGPDQPVPDWFGGTPGYMSPEQQAAVDAVREGDPVPVKVDGRSDLYSLAVVLYEALGGVTDARGVPAPAWKSLRDLRRRNPQVSRGLADVLEKCLAEDPRERYRTGSALAEDLRRHLADLPLRGVRNRSVRERWRKWRRRSPYALLAWLLFVLLAGVGGSAGLYMLGETRRQLAEARLALEEGTRQYERGDLALARETLDRGRRLAENLLRQGELRQALDRQYRLVRRADVAQKLHELVNRLGFSLAADALPQGKARQYEGEGRALWEMRARLLAREGADLGPDREKRLEMDLQDLAPIWTDLRVRLAPRGEQDVARKEALAVLAEAVKMFGSSPVLEYERKRHAEHLGLKEEARVAGERLASSPPETPWARYALARALIRAGQHEQALAQLEEVLADEPQHFWPNFYKGVCAFRLGRHDEAVHAFSVCVALSPRTAQCYYNRGLARSARGESEAALRDYDRALELDADLAAAACNRGLLHHRAGQEAKTEAERSERRKKAEDDFRYALRHGLETPELHVNLAVLQKARNDRDAAEASLRRALRLNPEHREAKDLLRALTGRAASP